MKSLPPLLISGFLLTFSNLVSVNPAMAVQVAPPVTTDDQSAQKPKPAPAEWIKVKPEGAWASIEMPIQPTSAKQTLTPIKDQPPITIHKYRATLADGSTSFLLVYHDFPERPEPTEINQLLENTIRNGIGNVRGLLAQSPQKTDKNTGRKYRFVYSQYDKRYVVNARLLLVGRRLYQVNCIMEENAYDKTVAARYLRSFNVFEPDDELPPRPPIK